jgi:hypothetical protein
MCVEVRLKLRCYRSNASPIAAEMPFTMRALLLTSVLAAAISLGAEPEAAKPPGVVSADCVQGQSGPQCLCRPGFTSTATQGCAPTSSVVCTTQQDCNALPSMSSFAGSSEANGGGGTVCVCSANFGLDGAGRCAPLLCFESRGSTCSVLLNGAPAPDGVCGAATISAGCVCGKTNGVYQPLCTGACAPTADGGVVTRCSPYNCRSIDFGHCEERATSPETAP